MGIGENSNKQKIKAYHRKSPSWAWRPFWKDQINTTTQREA